MNTENQSARAPRSGFTGKLFWSGLGLTVVVVVGLLLGKAIQRFSTMTSLSDLTNQHSGRDQLAEFKNVYRDFLILQKIQASDATWEQFKLQVQKRTDPEIEYMKETACADYPQLQQLLWAGRDYLPWMMDTARSVPSEAQIKFVKHIKEADRLINQN
ncbi:hypothetical protein Pan153_62010 [Gimesia panareensis]|uniref:Uncharacterized protein n=1 Tax=Gimesia panareensis TaxID=2527978 RepID=A0A518FYV2_9PLAN|nr:hypothetical protein [Gimesia panareensis]QDV21511.1 hypothetical protein Pan153_62010 [Gimesia panareensis]